MNDIEARLHCEFGDKPFSLIDAGKILSITGVSEKVLWESGLIEAKGNNEFCFTSTSENMWYVLQMAKNIPVVAQALWEWQTYQIDWETMLVQIAIEMAKR